MSHPEFVARMLSEVTDGLADAGSKYGPDSILSRIPYLRSQTNALLGRTGAEVKKHYFPCGTKKLILERECDGITIFLVHLGLRSHTRARQISFLHEFLPKERPIVLAGDFNIAPADADLWNPQTWPDKILTTAPERTALERLLSDGFVDAFRAFPQKEKQFSWWDYRMAAYEQNHGLRIDLMLASDALRPALKACQIDETPRAWAKPSDHAPVVTMLSF